MIALVILVSLIFTANYSYSLYINYWNGRLGDFDRTMFHYQGLLQVKETIDSSIPYVVGNDKGDYTFYFLGRDQGFTLVTAAPLFAPTINDASVVRIFSEQVEDGHQLVYEEAPLSDALLLNLEQQLQFKYRTVLLRSAEPIAFSYYGWDVREHKFNRQTHPSAVASWKNQYDAAQTRIQPEQIEMRWGRQKLLFDLPEGHEKLINFYINKGDY